MLDGAKVCERIEDVECRIFRQVEFVEMEGATNKYVVCVPKDGTQNLVAERAFLLKMLDEINANGSEEE